MTHLRTCSLCPPPTLALFRHVKYNTEVTRGPDILPMLLSPAHTRYHHHHQHMKAPNTGAANTLLKRPRLAQCSAHAVWCSNSPVPCTTLFDSRSISPCVLYQSARRHYTGCLQTILPSRSLAASRSARSLHHNTITIPAAVTAVMYCCTLQYARLTSSALHLTLMCTIKLLT